MDKNEPETFAEFWSAYPRRVGKQAAIRMYKKALKLTTSANILRGARLYANERAGQDQSFTKHPATWLNAGCWDDYPESKAYGAVQKTVFIKEGTPQWDAWQAHLKATTGRKSPSKNFGWHFPSEWPPNVKPKDDEQAVELGMQS